MFTISKNCRRYHLEILAPDFQFYSNKIHKKWKKWKKRLQWQKLIFFSNWISNNWKIHYRKNSVLLFFCQNHISKSVKLPMFHFFFFFFDVFPLSIYLHYCISISTNIYMCIYLHIYIYIYISISIYLYIYIYLYISISIYIYLYIYICLCLYMKLKYVAKFEVLVIVNAPMGSWPVVICY